MNRSFTRLKTVFVSFYKVPRLFNFTTGTYDDGTGNLPQESKFIPLKECNFFYHPQYIQPGYNNQSLLAPMADAGNWGYQTFLYKTEPELQLQVGSKLFPEIPIRSSHEAYYQLRKALGSHQPVSAYAVNISDHEYRNFKFIVTFDCEQQTNVGFSGLNTRAGDLITLKALRLKK